MFELYFDILAKKDLEFKSNYARTIYIIFFFFLCLFKRINHKILYIIKCQKVCFIVSKECLTPKTRVVSLECSQCIKGVPNLIHQCICHITKIEKFFHILSCDL